MSAQVDVVVAVHDPARPVDRAVRSALSAAAPGVVRAIVVAHNTDPAGIGERLGVLARHPDVRLLDLQDGIRSPAGPFNAGLDAVTARFSSVLGSDDELAPGAVASWLRRADCTGADAVMTRLRHAGGAVVPTPPVRALRIGALDPVRDRLSYRSAPLGLVSTARFGDLRFATGLPVGEDVPYVTRLWFSGARIAYDRRGPAYLIHTDVGGRTTVAPRPIADELAYVPVVLDDPWFTSLAADARAAIAVKLVRIHVFGAVTNRPDPAAWSTADREALRERAARILASGAGIERVLSRRDRAVLDAALDPSTDTAILIERARLRRQRAHPDALLPRDLRHTLHREAPLRLSAASALQLL
ncbi:glycosyltransferase family 2 protein [Microbacterium hominis]|uniref:Glycosyltransferase family 2 protein n=1 Tax=Microbacterium hominis TaxID=162426 RepID=A0A7D4THE1_9MICO|nr:glycosyltransferase family 2 protein [Microbacterium hominis]QKJ20021.1 glycosyltransferase family 2 protein [Microbacterium hominis]